jgi:hypothetical protein
MTDTMTSQNINLSSWDTLYICSDIAAVIAALAKTITEWTLVWESMKVLEELIGSNKITSVWIPGHHLILQNEGDKSVKEGANKVPSDQTVGIPFAVEEESFETEAPEQVEGP